METLLLTSDNVPPSSFSLICLEIKGFFFWQVVCASWQTDHNKVLHKVRDPCIEREGEVGWRDELVNGDVIAMGISLFDAVDV